MEFLKKSVYYRRHFYNLFPGNQSSESNCQPHFFDRSTKTRNHT